MGARPVMSWRRGLDLHLVCQNLCRNHCLLFIMFSHIISASLVPDPDRGILSSIKIMVDSSRYVLKSQYNQLYTIGVDKFTRNYQREAESRT